MRKKRAKDIKKEVLLYMRENKIDLRFYKGCYRRAKKDYNEGLI